ncbi:N-acetyl sugar amidotransferase [Desulfovibrio sp. OttesenSCG-928-C06]|nr:N-acetyl sugar amidotransferase [Desulfovibrio sp. OttesenSCG-928-C06]
MRFCKKCVMPDTRPGIYFDDAGVCQACRAEEKKDHTDWVQRWNELERLCDKHRGKYGKHSYDCIIAVSGGKDSHVQIYTVKEKLGMNPLLVSVEDNFTTTATGAHNLKNISEAFGCNIISIKPNIRAQKSLMRTCFEKWGKPTWFIDRLIYTYPIIMGLKFRLPLIFYGENVGYEYGGHERVETPSAKAQINNGVASDIPFAELIGPQVTEEDLCLCRNPEAELAEFELEPVYLSYYIRWNSYENYISAKRMGFMDLRHEWDREHTFECFDQVDSMAYLVHPWLKYPKFGHATATDYASKFIRYGLISREEGVKLVREYDHKLDQRAVQDFCSFAGYTLREFYEIVDRYYNPDLFTRNRYGEWVLKTPVWA